MSTTSPKNRRIYLDYAATTPLSPAAAEVMALAPWGNPSSMHWEGHRARVAFDDARRDIAGVLDCAPRDIIFTGSATAADNLAVRGVVEYAMREMDSRNRKDDSSQKPHIVISAIEHHAVQRPAELLEQQGMVEVTQVRPQPDGVVAVDDVLNAVQDNTVLVSIMMVNSEIGTIQPVREIAKGLRALPSDRRPVFHTDAVQAAAWVDVRPQKLGVDLLTLSAHKIYGPKGIGLLYVRDGIVLAPLICGGGQERGLLAGTPNVPSIVGFAKAFQLVRQQRDEQNQRVGALRDDLLEALRPLSWVSLTGSRNKRIPANIHLTLEGVSAENAVIALDREGIAVATGSACASGSAEPSHVLTALGYSGQQARCGLRTTLGYTTTKQEIARAKEVIPATLQRLRNP